MELRGSCCVQIANCFTGRKLVCSVGMLGVQFCSPLRSRSLRDNFETRPVHSREKVGRNDPCPCGSGGKYNHCCLKVAPASDDSPWSRQREASDRLTGDMQDFASRRFGKAMRDAWEDFNQTALPLPFEKNRD